MSFLVQYFRVNLMIYLLMSMSSINVNSQTTFEKYYDTLGCYYANSVLQNNDNGYVFCGSSYDASNAQQAAIIRTDSMGNIIWVKEYGGVTTDGAISCVLTHDSNILVVGIKDQYSITDGRVWFMKLDQGGSILWEYDLKIQSGSNQPEEVSLCEDKGFIITGFCNNQSTIGAIPFALRIDSAGNVLWSKTYGYSLYSSFHSGVETSEGGFVFTGEMPIGVASEIFLVKTDSAGDTLWTRKFGNANVDVGYSVRVLNDSSIVVAGATYDTAGWDIHLSRFTQNGSMMWKKQIGDGFENTAHSLQVTQDGNLLVCGTTQTASLNYQALLLKLDFNGDTLWSNTFGDVQSDIAYHAISCNDNGYVLVGKSDFFQTHGAIYFVKVDQNGLLNRITEITNQKNILELFPNPVSESIVVKLNGEFNDDFDIIILDISGKICSQVKNCSNNAKVNMEFLKSGVYIIQIESKEKIYSKLFIKQ